jgi:hypothetical protein
MRFSCGEKASAEWRGDFGRFLRDAARTKCTEIVGASRVFDVRGESKITFISNTA